MPSGYPASPRSFTVPTPARACRVKGSDRRGGQAGENQPLVNAWISWVLVDNKSVAEIGEKHLVWCGFSALRALPASAGTSQRRLSTRHTSTARRPITVTGGELERAARVFALQGHKQLSK
jgi:hypothetical protein